MKKTTKLAPLTADQMQFLLDGGTLTGRQRQQLLRYANRQLDLICEILYSVHDSCVETLNELDEANSDEDVKHGERLEDAVELIEDLACQLDDIDFPSINVK
jgi:hypothetical protein